MYSHSCCDLISLQILSHHRNNSNNLLPGYMCVIRNLGDNILVVEHKRLFILALILLNNVSFKLIILPRLVNVYYPRIMPFYSIESLFK